MSNIEQAIKEGYGQVARAGISSRDAGAAAIARAFGYSADDLAGIPAEANMGLSCGNPIAMASLKPGEVVLDLGAGGGLDVFLAAKAVGPNGRAIGVDMTPEMVDLARRNAEQGGYANVDFHLAPIEGLPLPDASVDCVISNCVLNLVEDKDRAFAEIFRVLKPGGRLAVSDIALRKQLPGAIESEVAAWVGCVSGAILIEENEAKLKTAGFSDVVVIDSGADLNAYKEMEGQAACCPPRSAQADGCCAPQPKSVHEGLGELIKSYDLNEFAASVKILALKR